MRRLVLAAVVVFAVADATAASQSLMLEASLADRLHSLRVGERVEIADFPDGFGGTSTIAFRRVDVYAAGAKVIQVDAGGEKNLPRSARIELIGASADGSIRTSMSLDPDGTHLSGSGLAPSGPFAIRGERADGRTVLHAMPVASSLPAGVTPMIVPSDDALPSGRAAPSALEIALSGQPSGTLRGAVLAVDTDNEFMSERFSNNTAAATAWIADLITAMNVMYERDVDVTLQQGTTYLRTAPDPYTVTDSPADGTNLDEFGNYWAGHYGAVPRSFAALLSGKSSSQNSASGIAWIDAYCANQSQGGSYSVTQVFTNPQISVYYSALIVGHELGHNFGAFHTHCTNVSNGSAPTASNTIDQCYSGESGCYSGATSCPSSGPGAPAGTIMSYCNVRGCGSDGQNVLQFHPTQIGVIDALVAANTPSCLSANADIIFRNGFD